MGNKVAGVAFQNLSGAENIGWVFYLVSLCLADSSTILCKLLSVLNLLGKLRDH